MPFDASINLSIVANTLQAVKNFMNSTEFFLRSYRSNCDFDIFPHNRDYRQHVKYRPALSTMFTSVLIRSLT
jgi:hypothetical protein